MVNDRTVGGIGLFVLTAAFTYYTLWTLATPFLPAASPLRRLFPLSREWAIRLPALLLLCGLCFVGMATGWVLIETARHTRAAVGSAARRVRARPHSKAD